MKKNSKNKNNNYINFPISHQEFLKKYWNKKPLLIKNAVSDAKKIASFSDFFDMGNDEEFLSRLVYESGGEYPWQAIKGPFKNLNLKKKGLWTLIIHNLELYHPFLFELKKELRFVSDWHFDDVMATISKKGASVGAHIDDYSVFIFQGHGKRKWLLDTKPNHEYQEDLDIRLLKKFNPNIEWVLEPGDMIYIPPGVAHHGVSLEDSVSYSLGFQSLRFKHVINNLIESPHIDLDAFSYRHDESMVAKDPFEISKSTLQKMKSDFLKMINSKDFFENIILETLSKSKTPIFPQENFDIDEYDFLKLLKKQKFKRDIWSKLVCIHEAKRVKFSIDSKIYSLEKKNFEIIRKQFISSPFTDLKIAAKEMQNDETRQVIFDLFQRGIFYF